MPIRLRLALWYSAILGVVLLVFGLFSYFLMAQHQENQIDEEVTSRAEHLVAELRTANPVGSPDSTIRTPALESFETPDVYIRVLNGDGSVIAQSANLAGQDIPIPKKPLQEGKFLVSFSGADMKVYLAPVVLGSRPPVWVQVAASYRQRDAMLQRLRLILISGGLGAVAVAGLLSFALARSSLRPVTEMMETAQAIALSRGFSRRLGEGNPNDELGQLARTFNEMLASLEQSYLAQQRFTADASHELRSPLTSIRGNLDLLQRVKDMPPAEREDRLGQVRREVERLSRLVNELLVLARADAGQTLELKPVELDALLVEVYHQSQNLAKGIVLRINRLAPALVLGDEDRLRELLLILVDNAVHYTPEGGSVSLSLEREPPWVSLVVEDSGMGIEPQDLPHLFQRFWRSAAARSRHREGAGLGLAIAKWIVDQHGGNILVDSTPGKGTRFTIRFPSAPTKPPSPSS